VFNSINPTYSGIYLVCILIICLPVLINAQNSLQTKNDLPEIIELNYDETELLNWQVTFRDTVKPKFKPVYRIDAKPNWNPDKELLTTRLIFSATDAEAASFPQLKGVFYQKLQAGKEPVNLGQLCLKADFKGMLRTFSMGSFRLQVGEGLCLGAYNPSAKKQSIYIYPVQGLSHPALTGFVSQFNYGNADVIGWLSDTSRIASLQENTIQRLYESSLTSSDDKDKIQEKTAGMVAAFNKRGYQLGLLYYTQSYNHGFSEASFKPVQDLYGVFAEMDNKPIKISGEMNLAKDKLAQALNCRYQSNNFSQTLRYYLRPTWLKPSYSKTQQIFGQATGNQELSWDFRYKPMQRLTLTTRIAAFRDLTNNTDTDWKERLIWAADWHEKGWHSSLTWYRFRKTAVPGYDTLSAELLPTQNRIKAFWEKNITASVQYGVTCQYQHYLDQKVIKNGFSMQQSVSYNTNRLDWSLFFLVWTNQKSSYQPTELLTSDELLIQSDSDTAFRAYVKYNLSKQFSFNLSAYRPNRKVSRQSYQFSLQTVL